MNYYEKIKNELINNEVYKKVKDYSKNRSDSEFAKNEATCKKQQILTESEENVNEIKGKTHGGE